MSRVPVRQVQGRILFEGTIVQRPQEGIAEDPIVLPVTGDALFVGGSHQLIVRVGREDDGKDEPVPRVLGRPHGTVYGTGPLIEGYLLYGHVGRVPVAGVPHPLHVQVPVRVVHVDDDQVSDPHRITWRKYMINGMAFPASDGSVLPKSGYCDLSSNSALVDAPEICGYPNNPVTILMGIDTADRYAPMKAHGSRCVGSSSSSPRPVCSTT